MSMKNIVPLIRPSEFRSATANVAAQFHLSEESMRMQLPIQVPYLTDIVITYAWSLSEQYEFINQRHLLKFGMNIEELHYLAVENLFRLLPDVSVQDLALYKAISTGDDLEASTILMDNVWDQLAGRYSGKLRMVVPVRDVVLFQHAGADVELDSERIPSEICKELMLNSAREERREYSDRRVSGCVFEWSECGWITVGQLDSEDNEATAVGRDA